MEILHARRWEKSYRNNFYQGVVKVCVGSIWYGGIEKSWDKKLCMNFIVWFSGPNIFNQFSIKTWYSSKSF